MSAFSPRALGQSFSKQPKITCHIVIRSSWGQTRQLQEIWVQIELLEVCMPNTAKIRFDQDFEACILPQRPGSVVPLAIFVSVSTPVDFYVLVIELQNCNLLFSVLMYFF